MSLLNIEMYDALRATGTPEAQARDAAMVLARVETSTLTLPMRKRRGFQTVHCCTSRGLVQARQSWRIAATLAARRSGLPTAKESPSSKRIRPLLVLTPRWSPAYPLSSCLDGNRFDNDREVEQHPLQP